MELPDIGATMTDIKPYNYLIQEVMPDMAHIPHP